MLRQGIHICANQYTMEILAYIAALLVGISLGLVGGGGSILTVPVLVYLFGLTPLLATSYSLFIVGSTSFVGAVNNYRKGFVNVRTTLLFGFTSIITVFATRRFILPIVPDNLFSIGNFLISRDTLTMLLFALLMLLAAVAMIRNSSEQEKGTVIYKVHNLPKLIATGAVIGLTTGLLGAGGGFLLIPALVLLVGLPIREAIGTSLLIIALNSLIGFTGDIGHVQMNWIFLFKITAMAIAGILVGGFLSKVIDGAWLKKTFGWFVLVMGIYILIKELLFR